jgi:hypothetical protein
MADEPTVPEPLLAGTGISLFGRKVAGLTIDLTVAGSSLGGGLARLSPAGDNRQPSLARIYGFSFEGQYYDLVRPAVFLVHGEGEQAANRLAKTGTVGEPPAFADDVRIWQYDRADFSLRLELDVGPLERILLEAELPLDGPAYAGANVRQAGANVRLRQAGANVRYAGANVRLRGGGSGD